MRVVDGSLRLRLGGMAAVLIGAGMAVAMPGCEASSPQADDPTTRALADPMNYSPTDPPTDITGGGPTQFDKDAFNRDMNHVLNP